MEHGVRIIPVVVRSCLFEESRYKYPDPIKGPYEFTLASLQASNSPNTPLNGMNEQDQDAVLLKVARALHALAHVDRSGRSPQSETPRPRSLFKEDISRIRKSAANELIGREEKLKLLNSAWTKVRRQHQKRPHIIIFEALAGRGKHLLWQSGPFELRSKAGRIATQHSPGRFTVKAQRARWRIHLTCSCEKHSSSSATWTQRRGAPGKGGNGLPG